MLPIEDDQEYMILRRKIIMSGVWSFIEVMKRMKWDTPTEAFFHLQGMGIEWTHDLELKWKWCVQSEPFYSISKMRFVNRHSNIFATTEHAAVCNKVSLFLDSPPYLKAVALLDQPYDYAWTVRASELLKEPICRGTQIGERILSKFDFVPPSALLRSVVYNTDNSVPKLYHTDAFYHHYFERI